MPPLLTIENERQMTDDALQILAKAKESVKPRTAIQSCLSTGHDGDLVLTDLATKSTISYKRGHYDEVVIVSFGKASSTMALTSAEIVSKAWPNVDISGITIVKDNHADGGRGRSVAQQV